MQRRRRFLGLTRPSNTTLDAGNTGTSGTAAPGVSSNQVAVAVPVTLFGTPAPTTPPPSINVEGTSGMFGLVGAPAQGDPYFLPASSTPAPVPSYTPPQGQGSGYVIHRALHSILSGGTPTIVPAIAAPGAGYVALPSSPPPQQSNLETQIAANPSYWPVTLPYTPQAFNPSPTPASSAPGTSGTSGPVTRGDVYVAPNQLTPAKPSASQGTAQPLRQYNFVAPSYTPAPAYVPGTSGMWGLVGVPAWSEGTSGMFGTSGTSAPAGWNAANYPGEHGTTGQARLMQSADAAAALRSGGTIATQFPNANFSQPALNIGSAYTPTVLVNTPTGPVLVATTPQATPPATPTGQGTNPPAIVASYSPARGTGDVNSGGNVAPVYSGGTRSNAGGDRGGTQGTAGAASSAPPAASSAAPNSTMLLLGAGALLLAMLGSKSKK